MDWSFLDEATPEVGELLLGCVLEVGGGVSGVIVETEFYSDDDPASHTFNGPTPRNAPMFDNAGTLYAYVSYGIHICANVVVGPVGCGSAVLIRALRPLSGIETMFQQREKARTERDLCSGPGKLCQALRITADQSGLDLLDPASAVRLKPPAQPLGSAEVLSGPRIGITRAVERPWRFGLSGEASLSRPFR